MVFRGLVSVRGYKAGAWAATRNASKIFASCPAKKGAVVTHELFGEPSFAQDSRWIFFSPTRKVGIAFAAGHELKSLLAQFFIIVQSHRDNLSCFNPRFWRKLEPVAKAESVPT
jgi:hypothetical protein